MLLLLLLFKEWDNIKLRCFKIIIIPFLVNTISCNTNQMLQDSPQSTALDSWTRCTWCLDHITCPLIHPLHSLLKKGSCTRWCHPASSSLPCPLPYSQLSCLPSILSSLLSSCLVLGALLCHPTSWFFPSSIQHYCTLLWLLPIK